MSRERLADAALASGALVAVLAVAAALAVDARPLALAAGAGGTVLAEFALDRRHAAVRRVWRRRAVKGAAVGAFAVALAGAVALEPATGLSLLAGGLVGYLGLLAGVTLGDATRG